jgi:hypothetical protein
MKIELACAACVIDMIILQYMDTTLIINTLALFSCCGYMNIHELRFVLSCLRYVRKIN